MTDDQPVPAAERLLRLLPGSLDEDRDIVDAVSAVYAEGYAAAPTVAWTPTCCPGALTHAPDCPVAGDNLTESDYDHLLADYDHFVEVARELLNEWKQQAASARQADGLDGGDAYATGLELAIFGLGEYLAAIASPSEEPGGTNDG